MDFTFITVILQLIFLECILSIDNAAVIGAMVAHLPTDQTTPWPRRLRPLVGRLDRYLGSQREAALKVGLLGAYAGRILMLALASVISTISWVKIIGALYLVYLAIKHFVDLLRERYGGAGEGDHAARKVSGGFWNVVLTIELADLAFSLDNVVAAVALSDRLWVVILGVMIGIVVIRFAATIFTRMIEWEPAMEHAAYLLLIAIGGELLVAELLHIELDDWVKFAISIAILVLTVAVARLRALLAARGHAPVEQDVQ